MDRSSGFSKQVKGVFCFDEFMLGHSTPGRDFQRSAGIQRPNSHLGTRSLTFHVEQEVEEEFTAAGGPAVEVNFIRGFVRIQHGAQARKQAVRDEGEAHSRNQVFNTGRGPASAAAPCRPLLKFYMFQGLES